MTLAKLPDDAAVNAFWSATRTELLSAQWEEFFGLRVRSSLRPPSVQLSEDAQEATKLAREVADDQLHRLVTPTADFEGEEPEVGDLMIVCDGQGEPVALVQTSAVGIEGDNTVETLECLFPVPEAKARKR